MFEYANSFTCAIAGDTRTVVLRFAQQVPVFLPSGEIGDTVETVPVASVVLDKDVASALGKALAALAADQETEE